MRIATAVSLLLTVIGVAVGLVYRPAASSVAAANPEPMAAFTWPATVPDVDAPPVLVPDDPATAVRTLAVVFTIDDDPADPELRRYQPYVERVEAAACAKARWQGCRPGPLIQICTRPAPDQPAHDDTGPIRQQIAMVWELVPLPVVRP